VTEPDDSGYLNCPTNCGQGPPVAAASAPPMV